MYPTVHTHEATTVLPSADSVFAGQLSHVTPSRYLFAEHTHASLCSGLPVKPESHVQSESAVLPPSDTELAGQLRHVPTPWLRV